MRVRVAVGYSTHVDVSLDLEVAVLAPVGTPAVLHYPVLHSVLESVASCEYCVVDVLGFVGAEGR